MSTPNVILEEVCKKLGYSYFTKGNYNLNVIVIRNPKDNTNLFDDVMYVTFAVDDENDYYSYRCTADPGKSSLLNPHNPKGCARLCDGQVRGSHEIGLHKGRPALRQCKGFPYQRDNTRLGIHHMDGPVYTDIIFADIHDTVNENDGKVDGQSEGCVVLRYPRDLLQLLTLVNKQKANGMGDKISLTILDAGKHPELLVLL